MSDNLIRVAEPALSEKAYEYVRAAMDSGQLAQGEFVREFERKWADYVGVEHAIAVSSGTTALHLALRAAGIGEGDKVAVPNLSFAATATAVLHEDAIPVFCDIEADTYCLDPLEVPWTDVEAVIPVHLYGHPAEMGTINHFADKHGVTVGEDAAQAHGATHDGAVVGGLGDLGCFSFYATKNITTAEGGMVTTDDDAMAADIRRWRSHGMTDRDTHEDLGFNYRMSEVHAAIGVAQLERLDELNERRAEHTKFLLDAIRDDGPEWLQPATPREHVEHAWFWAPVEVDSRYSGKAVWRGLLDAGVETRHRYLEPLAHQPVFRRHHWAVDTGTPVARRVAGQVLGLPNHPGLTEDDLDRILTILRSYDP